MGFIRNRLVNWLAKIAGSPDAEDITPKEPIEYYLKEIAEQKANAPVVPKPAGGDTGKILAVDAQGEYELRAETPAPEELPAVTSDDNGDVLTVVEGVWTALPLPAPIDYVFAIAITGTPSGYVCDKTVDEIANAIKEDKSLIITSDVQAGTMYIQTQSYPCSVQLTEGATVSISIETVKFGVTGTNPSTLDSIEVWKYDIRSSGVTITIATKTL